MTNMLSNLPKEYPNIVEITEDWLDDEDDPLTIEIIRDELSVKYYSTNKKSGPKIQENKKNLYVNPNIRVPAQLTGYKRTSKNTAGIEKALTYKIFTNVTKPDMPRTTVSLKKTWRYFG